MENKIYGVFIKYRDIDHFRILFKNKEDAEKYIEKEKSNWRYANNNFIIKELVIY